VASSGQSRARMTARQHNVSAAHGAGIPTDLPSWFGPRMTASLRTWLSPSCGCAGKPASLPSPRHHARRAI